MPSVRRLVAVLSRLGPFARERGVGEVLGSCGQWAWQWVRGRPRAGRDPESFLWGDRAVPYFVHHYHYTWLNERAVEVALAVDVLSERAAVHVLEIGNVLSHYVPVSHAVVDKYEQAPGVLNADVADLNLSQEFDLIVAISTLEHVGLDEENVDPAKPARAIKRLREHLKPGGMLWVTHPVGYNLTVDEQLRAGELGFDRLRALRRETSRNVWREVPVEDVWGVPYDRLLYTAHALVVAEFEAPGDAAPRGRSQQSN